MRDHGRMPSLLELVFGYTAAKTIDVAARLGIADHLAHGQRTTAELAGTTGTHERSLRRLACFGVVVQTGQDTFALGPAGQRLRSDSQESVRSMVMLLCADETWHSDFTRYGTIVDISGGDGSLRPTPCVRWKWLGLGPAFRERARGQGVGVKRKSGSWLVRLTASWGRHDPVRALMASSDPNALLRNDIYFVKHPLPSFVAGRRTVHTGRRGRHAPRLRPHPPAPDPEAEALSWSPPEQPARL